MYTYLRRIKMKRKKFLQGLISFLTAALMFFAFGCAAGKESGGENLSGSDSLRESQSSEGDKDAPLAYFSFDGLDANGNFYDLVSGKAAYAYGEPQRTAGKNDSALALSDGASFLSFAPAKLPTGNAAHSICAWIKLDYGGITPQSEHVAAGWGSYENISDTRLMIYHNQLCVTSFNVCTFYPIPKGADKDWYHLALTYDGETYAMYLNAVLVAEVSCEGIDIQNSPLYIGGFGDGILCFSGGIDDLYIFDRALTRKEIVTYKNNEGEFAMKDPDNLPPAGGQAEVFSAEESVLEGGWNEFRYLDGKTSLPFQIFIPDDYDAAKKYPLMMFLHGDGSNGQSVEKILLGEEAVTVRRALVEKGECIVIVPAAPSPWLIVPNDANVVYPYRSYSMDDAAPSAHLLAAEKLLDECIAHLRVDESKVYLTGYSRGTMASWYLLSQTPEKFAAAIVCSGAGDPDSAYKFKEVPVWLFMGDADPLVSYGDICKIVSAYGDAGGADMKFTVCRGAGHGVENWMYAEEELIDWLFSKSKKVSE